MDLVIWRIRIFIGENWIMYLLLSMMIIVGLILTTPLVQDIAFLDDNNFLGEIAKHLGLALVIASILAFSVDINLKKRLARDVVREALGYGLAPEIRRSVHWLYGLQFLCESSETRVVIGDVNDQVVSLNVTQRRVLKNVTDRIQNIRPRIEVTETLLANYRAKITKLIYRLAGQDGVETKGQPGFDLHCEGKATELGLSSKKDVAVTPGETISIDTEYIIYRRRTDKFIDVFGNATKNPHIVVDAPDELGVFVTFGNDEQGIITKSGDKTYDFEGTLLPYQPIEIRWWDKIALDAWKSEDTAA